MRSLTLRKKPGICITLSDGRAYAMLTKGHHCHHRQVTSSVATCLGDHAPVQQMARHALRRRVHPHTWAPQGPCNGPPARQRSISASIKKAMRATQSRAAQAMASPCCQARRLAVTCNASLDRRQLLLGTAGIALASGGEPGPVPIIYRRSCLPASVPKPLLAACRPCASRWCKHL